MIGYFLVSNPDNTRFAIVTIETPNLASFCNYNKNKNPLFARWYCNNCNFKIIKIEKIVGEKRVKDVKSFSTSELNGVVYVNHVYKSLKQKLIIFKSRRVVWNEYRKTQEGKTRGWVKFYKDNGELYEACWYHRVNLENPSKVIYFYEEYKICLNYKKNKTCITTTTETFHYAYIVELYIPFYADNKLSVSQAANYKNSLQNGFNLKFNESGRVKSKKCFKNNKIHGLNFSDGRIIGIWRYNNFLPSNNIFVLYKPLKRLLFIKIF
jgi:antitoxin component YwqK of YwqJK toxin-antitoxin module